MFMKIIENQTYALMRIMTGFLFLWHGSRKLLDFPASGHEITPFLKYAGGSIELFGGLFVMIGLFTGWAGFVCSGTMAVAYWMSHGTKAFLPLLNRGEMAVLYCFVFLFISAKGGGIWSIDRLLGKRRSVE